MRKSNKLSYGSRIFYFIIGIALASLLIVFSFRWEDLPFIISIFGTDQTRYLFAPILVLSGIIASSFIKSSIDGKKEIDS